MQSLIFVERNIARLLPLVRESLFDEASSEVWAKPGQRLLALANEPLSMLQRFAGWGLGDQARVSRLLLLFRHAFEAERSGRFIQADFFWRAAHDNLERLWPDTAAWQSAYAAIGATQPLSADDVCDAVGRELFIDAHAGFANARLAEVEDLSPNDRAVRHLAWLRNLVAIVRLPHDEAVRLLSPALKRQIQSCVAKKRWSEAIGLARGMLALTPGDWAWQEQTADLIFANALDRLAPRPEGSELWDARILAQAIDEIDDLRKREPANIVFYRLLGQLHHLLGIRLAQGNGIAEGLVSAKRAQLFAPGVEGYEKTMSDLTDAMGTRKQQVAALEDELRKTPGQSLNAVGLRIQADARRGFGPVETFLKSDEPGLISTDRQAALAREIWRDAKLPPPVSDWNQAAATLLTVLGSIYASDATTTTDIAKLFRDAVTNHAELEGVDPDLVAAFIERRRRENVGGASASTAEPAEDADPDVPIIRTDTFVGRDREPFGYWLFGLENKGTRFVAALACLVALATLVLGPFDLWGEHVRSEAYTSIIAATVRDDDRSTIDAGERFLNARVFRADYRESQVRELLAAAEERPAQRVRDRAVDALMASVSQGDSAAAMDACENFLKALSPGARDPRESQVRGQYSRAFVQWFASLEGPLDRASVARVDEYKRLMNATRDGRA